MSLREANLAVFERRPVEGVFFQPRIEPWLAWNKQFGNLSPRYREMEIRELFDDLGASMRYVDYYTGVPGPLSFVFGESVVVRGEATDTEATRIVETPFGELRWRSVRTVDDTWREVEFPVKTADHLRGLQWLLARSEHRFDLSKFRAGSEFIGDRGVPQFYLPKSPYQALAQSWMKLDDLVYAYFDHREVVEAALKAIDASYDGLYEQLVAASDEVRIVNLGENLHEQLISPAIFEAHYLPWYAKRMGQLRAAGIYTHVHIDGYFRHLLPYLADLPFDGLEALTPTPQGDVTIDEIAEATGDKVLLDLIPAVLFMPPFTEDDLMACVETIVRRVGTRLVLGVSDELPEGGGEIAIERCRLVADRCRRGHAD
ncbi:MAG: hypothetical protein KIS66_16215 [Fimbriimonadaceae bacterium]|nr:hypothetical protein [Fimbriimonadaceae bacterium]